MITTLCGCCWVDVTGCDGKGGQAGSKLGPLVNHVQAPGSDLLAWVVREWLPPLSLTETRPEPLQKKKLLQLQVK